MSTRQHDGVSSKIADYAAVGRPLLIWGPTDCSAVRWGLENDGVAEIVSDNSRSSIEGAVAKLVSDQDRRVELARNALSIGKRYFSDYAVKRTFFGRLGVQQV